ncbi:class III lanthipeptide [Micrococcus luteus]|nr:class III lanthipeptide [Micrococcus luteus]MCK6056790.1 class III lanthipeptide [Micrococcus luteus]MCK6061521.1 class III lanthipeptide [Micrococcus luteus]MCK6063984.1 class III lanthipeptide [Micrococcus luteus]MCK6192245.1 class III lanthipeptide [Micrococcus luteus]MCK6194325.1 class III lanthipeptide [Micrococcus luteus]
MTPSQRVLLLQDVEPELRSSDLPGLTSNLSIICKQQSTISIAVCLPGN